MSSILGSLPEEDLIESRPQKQGRRHEQRGGHVRVDLEQGEKPVAQIGHEDDNGALSQEDNAHGPEDQAQADGGETVHGPEKDAVDEELKDGSESEHAHLLQGSQIGILNFRVGDEFFARAFHNDFSGLHHIGVVANS